MCGFIGAQAQIDTSKTGGRNPLVELAQAIDIMGGQTEDERELDAMRGPMVAASAADDPRLGRTAADPEHGIEAENAGGSYEAFLGMFGASVPLPPEGGGDGQPG